MEPIMFKILKYLMLFQILAIVLACPLMAEKKDVCFKHKVTDVVRTNCFKNQGKNDPSPVIKCFDKSNNLEVFKPGDKWIEIDGNDPICKPKCEGKDCPDIPHGFGDEKSESRKEEK